MEAKVPFLKAFLGLNTRKLLTATLIFSAFSIFFAQNIGDYQSKITGNWNSASTWEVCTSLSPITWSPAATFPGKTPPTSPSTATSAVTITAGTVVTIPSGMSPTNLYFGNLSIYGKLNINTFGTTIDFKTTPNVLIDGGTLNFNANQLTVKFPAGAQIVIKGLGTGSCTNAAGVNGLGITGGSCSNQVELWIGDMLYTTCTGAGGAPFGGNFCDVNNAGGSVEATATPSTLCSGGNVNLSTQNYSSATYQWSLLSGPTGYTIPTGTNVNQQNIALNLSLAGTYVFKLTVTKNSGTVSDRVTVVVKPLPTATWSSTPVNVCYSSTSQTAVLPYSATTGSPTKYSISWNASPANNFAAITNATFAGTSTGGSINIPVPAGTAVGTYTGTISVKNADGCASSTQNFSIKVNPVLAANVSISASTSNTICSGTSVNFTATPTNGGTSPTYQWKLNGSSVGTNSATYTNSALVNGDQISVIMTSNATPCLSGSPATSNTISMIVNPVPSALVSGSGSLCSGSNAVFTINGTANSTVNYTINGGANNSVTLDSNGTAQVTVSSATSDQTLNISSVSNGNCTANGNSVTINVGASSVFNGTTWSNGIPNGGHSAIIDSDYSTSLGSFTACSCTVNSGKKLTIESDTYIDIQNEIVNNGTLIVESDGNIIQRNNSATNTGNIIVRRKAVVPSNQYMYWASPVEFMTGQSFKTIYPNIPTALYYNESNNYFYNSSGVNILGRGLAVKGPTSGGPAVTAEFKGKPWNGITEYVLNYSGANYGYNLVGNPYPSNIDLVQLYNDNSTKIESKIQFWDNTNNSQFTQQGSGYTGSSYAIFVAEGSGTSVPAPNNSAKSPSRYADVGQGFMVRAKSTIGTTDKKLRFSDSIRKTNAGVFFNRGAQQNIDDGKYWLRLSTPANNFNTIAITYSNGAGNGFESFDGLQNSASDMFYSLAENNKLAIQGRAFPFVNNDVVPLGFKNFDSGMHKIELVKTEGIFDGVQSVYLKDKQTNIVTNLSENSYSFTSEKGEFNNRFEIIYMPLTTMATAGNKKEEIQVYKDKTDFVVKSQTNKITEIEVYDASGRLVYRSFPNSNEVIIDTEKDNSGIYIMKIYQKGEIITRKILKE